MSLDSMLVQIARAVVPDGEETQRIVASLKTMGERLAKSFGTDVKKIDVFGSFTRGTMLSRVVDERSDVDLMIVFKPVCSSCCLYAEHQQRQYISFGLPRCSSPNRLRYLGF